MQKHTKTILKGQIIFHLKLFFSYFLIVFHKRCNYFLIDFVPFCPMAAKKIKKKLGFPNCLLL
jgi:hypothetical protein